MSTGVFTVVEFYSSNGGLIGTERIELSKLGVVIKTIGVDYVYLRCDPESDSFPLFGNKNCERDNFEKGPLKSSVICVKTDA
jgi:hypothetical protein